ncbi:hypothetical protein F5Y00DRAFT_246618 [Daldinia vernicosa]|uniref:uncharacterized protein n=1 Tax=Daldinia vernicosa TaxID=114800 RepID=UPI00200893A5|nr:uncharacterized protein F5Y00DRAFT_246618 [Daldinia vernicosa]KAI0845322.1 hypothetical protein F5Y00DRAFT_246618 [Daldinia vernicosa]
MSSVAVSSGPSSAFKFGTGGWDPEHRFETSWLFPPYVLFALRLLMALCVDMCIVCICRYVYVMYVGDMPEVRHRRNQPLMHTVYEYRYRGGGLRIVMYVRADTHHRRAS